MASADDDIVDRVHGLSDLELAVLLSLVSHEHCVIGTPADAVDSLVDELGLVALGVFGLRCAVVDCHQDLTLDEFSASLLLPAAPSPALTAATASTAIFNNNNNNNNNNSHRQHLPSRAATAAATDYFHLSPARRPSQSSYTPGPRSPRSPMSNPPTAALATPTVMANVVLAKNLNCAPEAVQIQALELMRTHHILTATAMQSAPKPFLLVAVVAAERGFLWDGGCVTDTDTNTASAAQRAPHMTAHLNDFFSMGHWHDPEYGYPNLEERDDADADAETEARDDDDDNDDNNNNNDNNNDNDNNDNNDAGTDSDSVIRLSESGLRGRSGSIPSTSYSWVTGRSGAPGRSIRAATPPPPPPPPPPSTPPLFTEADIDHLAARSKDVRVDMEVLRYQMNIIAFLRVHRAVAVVGPTTSGLSCVSPMATMHFEKLAKCLAPLHRLDYVTPALVALAARKSYLHRIRVVPVGHSGARLPVVHERSMQWGGDKVVVKAMLQGVSPEVVIESVLESLAPPV